MKAFLFLVAAVTSQLPGSHLDSGSGLAEQDAPLEAAAFRFAQAWVDGDGRALEEMMEAGGIRLHLQSEEHLSISPRQAGSSILSFMERYGGGEAEVTRASRIGEDPATGFAEIRWGCRVSGTSEPVIFTLFVAFARTGTEWVVTEIRVLP